MGKMSREKGKRGEREWASFCREHGYRNVRRSVQYSGRVGTAADCIGLPGIHQEIKRVEKLNLYDAVNQAVRFPSPYGDFSFEPLPSAKRINTNLNILFAAGSANPHKTISVLYEKHPKSR